MRCLPCGHLSTQLCIRLVVSLGTFLQPPPSGAPAQHRQGRQTAIMISACILLVMFMLKNEIIQISSTGQSGCFKTSAQHIYIYIYISIYLSIYLYIICINVQLTVLRHFAASLSNLSKQETHSQQKGWFNHRQDLFAKLLSPLATPKTGEIQVPIQRHTDQPTLLICCHPEYSG